MPRLSSIVMVFTFVLLPLTGCGSSSLLEAKTPAPEAIKIVEDYMANRLKESNDELVSRRKNNTTFGHEYEEKIDQKGTWKRKQLSDAEKFIGISEEWEFTNVILQRERYRTSSEVRGEIVQVWKPWEPWKSKEFQHTVIKVKGEWKTRLKDGSIR
jgi:hypothetical protein